MSPFVAEIIGTALLMLIGNGVVANCCLNGTKGNNGGWIVITTAWAFAVFVGVVVAGPYSGAHLNPAVTFGLAIAGKFAWGQVVPFIIAQLIGAMIGGGLVYAFYYDHFQQTETEGLKRACFATEPAIRNYKLNFFNEVVGTFVLMFVIFYITGAEVQIPESIQAYPIGLGSVGALPVAFLVWAIGLALGGTTGYAINPARDAGPRLVLTLVGKKINVNPDWQYGWLPVVAPMVGGALAAVLHLML